MKRLPETRIFINRRTFCRATLATAGVTFGAVSCGGSLPMAPAATVPPFPGLGDIPLLVDAEWLKANRDQIDNLLILDLSKPARYKQGHIPGAVHAWWQDTIEVNDPVYGTVLQPINYTDQTRRTELLQNLGIDDETWVIAYDDDRGRWAARLVWFLRFLGHDRVSALDGGLAAWRGDRGEVEKQQHAAPAGSIPTITPRDGYYIGDDAIAEWQDDPRTLIVDVRTDDEARDDVNNTLPIGRIPNAVSLPWTTNLRDDTGRLKSPDEISALLSTVGVSTDRRVLLYARYGVETTQMWLVLALMGFPEFVIYDRGWAGWVANPNNEVASL